MSLLGTSNTGLALKAEIRAVLKEANLLREQGKSQEEIVQYVYEHVVKNSVPKLLKFLANVDVVL